MISLSKKQKAMLSSYFRSMIAAMLAVVATGNYAPEDIGKAALAAVLPPLMRWANPKDTAFGRGA